MAGLAGRSSPQIQDFQAWIGPSIKQADFEVGAEVRDELLRATAVTPEMFVAARDGKYLADLQAMAVAQLVDAGVPLQAIEVYPVSTMQDPRLHSARRDKERSGRMATVVGICES
jgi:copper oxidase (laccase) domain-containing protein